MLRVPLNAAVVLTALAGTVGGCSAGAPGDACADRDDCDSSLQCFDHICTQRCTSAFECGDGYLCERGECRVVESAVGDACDQELDCGPGQSCQLDDADADGDGLVAATCQLEVPGTGTGNECLFDSECRGEICALGRCTQLCQTGDDCPGDLACVDIPRSLAGSDARFRGCLQATGVLRADIPVELPYQSISIPVPGNARSFAVVSEIGSPQLVGLASLTAPDGTSLYTTPASPAEYLDSPLRYQPALQASVAMVPNRPDLGLEVGIYRASVGSFTSSGGVGTAIPTVEILYKLDDGATLDLHFYFLDLTDHPCEDALGGPLDAAHAQLSSGFQTQYLARLEEIFADAGITIGEVTYQDVTDRPDLDGLSSAQLGSLASLADDRPGLHIFFTRSIDPIGIQALPSGTPGAPRVGGTPRSALAIATDTLCYRTWSAMARSSAHAMARQMGLFDSVDPDGTEDPIPDTDDGNDNLMYFGEFGGSELTAQQAKVLRKWPGLQ